MRNLLGQETFCQTMWSVSKLLPYQHVLPTAPHTHRFSWKNKDHRRHCVQFAQRTVIVYKRNGGIKPPLGERTSSQGEKCVWKVSPCQVNNLRHLSGRPSPPPSGKCNNNHGAPGVNWQTPELKGESALPIKWSSKCPLASYEEPGSSWNSCSLAIKLATTAFFPSPTFN